MPPPGRPPGLGLVFVGVAAASLATGPTLMVMLGIYELARREYPFQYWDLGDWISLAAYAALFCLIGSIPAASLNAFVLSRFARRGIDESVLAAMIGALIGLLVAILFGALAIGGRLETTLALWFTATGTLMGLLHWVIAIRPRRRWRLSLLRDDEAIRAME